MQQLQALNNLKAAVGSPNMTARWNDFGGSPDIIYDFASQPFQGTAEEAARAFVSQNAGLFGLSDANTIRVFSQKKALGGTLIRFQQVFNGVPVANGGIGVVMNANNQVIAVSGPFFRDVNVNTQPGLSADTGQAAADADLNRYAANVPSAVANLLQPALGSVDAADFRGRKLSHRSSAFTRRRTATVSFTRLRNSRPTRSAFI